MLEINKQKMSYSQQSGKVPVYVTDDDGNIEYSSYTDSDGNVIYYLERNEASQVRASRVGGVELRVAAYKVRQDVPVAVQNSTIGKYAAAD